MEFLGLCATWSVLKTIIWGHFGTLGHKNLLLAHFHQPRNMNESLRLSHMTEHAFNKFGRLQFYGISQNSIFLGYHEPLLRLPKFSEKILYVYVMYV